MAKAVQTDLHGGLGGTLHNEDTVLYDSSCFRIYDPQTRPEDRGPSPLDTSRRPGPNGVTAQMTTHDNDSHINMSTQFGLLMGSL